MSSSPTRNAGIGARRAGRDEQQTVRQPAAAHDPERERDRDEHLDEEREAGQHERRRQRAQEHGHHRLGLREAVPEVALEDPRDRRHVADGERIVEPVGLADALDGLGRCDRARQRARRVAGDDLDEQEARGRDDPDGDERGEQPPADVGDHRSPSSWTRRLSPTRFADATSTNRKTAGNRIKPGCER